MKNDVDRDIAEVIQAGFDILKNDGINLAALRNAGIVSKFIMALKFGVKAFRNTYVFSRKLTKIEISTPLHNDNLVDVHDSNDVYQEIRDILTAMQRVQCEIDIVKYCQDPGNKKAKK